MDQLGEALGLRPQQDCGQGEEDEAVAGMMIAWKREEVEE